MHGKYVRGGGDPMLLDVAGKDCKLEADFHNHSCLNIPKIKSVIPEKYFLRILKIAW